MNEGQSKCLSSMSHEYPMLAMTTMVAMWHRNDQLFCLAVLLLKHLTRICLRNCVLFCVSVCFGWVCKCVHTSVLEFYAFLRRKLSRGMPLLYTRSSWGQYVWSLSYKSYLPYTMFWCMCSERNDLNLDICTCLSFELSSQLFVHAKPSAN